MFHTSALDIWSGC